MVHGNFVRGKKFNTTSTLDGGHFSGVPWVSGLIEGKGRLYDPITGRLDEYLEMQSYCIYFKQAHYILQECQTRFHLLGTM